MICLNCVRNNLESVCGYCGECNHLCRLKCKPRQRLQKMDFIQKERYRAYCAPNPDPREKKVPAQTERKLAEELTCELCAVRFFKINPLQRFCSQKCGREVRNKNYRESRLTQGPPASDN